MSLIGDIIGTILHVLWVIYTYPVKLWHGYKSCHVDEFFGDTYCETHQAHPLWAVALGVLLYGVTILALYLISKAAYAHYRWRQIRMECQHCGRYTLNMPVVERYTCKKLEACCESCNAAHRPRQTYTTPEMVSLRYIEERLWVIYILAFANIGLLFGLVMAGG